MEAENAPLTARIAGLEYDPLDVEFARMFKDHLAGTDIEDPTAARIYAADEAFAELMDLLSDIRGRYAS